MRVIWVVMAGLAGCAQRTEPVAAGPGREPFCTRSLGVVDCWTNPQALPPGTREVRHAPLPTPVQERYRRAPWPQSLTVLWTE